MEFRSLKILFCTLSLVSVVWAGLPKPQVLRRQEVIQGQIGGQAGAGFSLLNVQRIESAAKSRERIIFSIGTREGQALKGPPGFFNAQNQKHQIVLDFAQMPTSRLDENSLRQIFLGSALVQGVRVTQDPIDKTLTLALGLKGPVTMKTIQIKGEKETARVVLEIMKK